MKKIICILLALSIAFAFAACNNGKDVENTTETQATTAAPAVKLEGTLEDITNKIIENTTTIETMLMGPMEVDLTNADTVKSFTGLDSADSIERAVFNEPMIGSIAFSMCLIDAKDGVDVEALKTQILEGVNYRKWVCVAAEKVLVANCGDTILMIMAMEEVVDDVYNAFNTVANGAASAPLTKAGEIQEEYPEGGLDLEGEVILG